MSLLVGDWRFDENVADIFDDHVRRSVPKYDELHEIVLQVLKPFLKKDSIVLDLGVGTGDFLSRMASCICFDNITYVAIDNSNSMLEKAKVKCKDIPNTYFTCANIEDYDYPKVTVSIAILTLQFIEVEKRQAIVRNIYESLQDGGAFILCEKICLDNAIGNIFVDIHEDFKLQNGISNCDIERKKRSLVNVMWPMSYNENRNILVEAGFEVVESFFQYFNFVGFLAIKKQNMG